VNPNIDDGKGIVSRQLGGLSTEAGGHGRQTGGGDTAEQDDGRAATGGDGTAPGPDSGRSPDVDGEAEALPLDQVFEILKNSRRRQTLHYLEQNGGEASLSDLAEHIAAIENDVAVEAITSSQRKRVYVGLYQCHLPKLDDKGIVDYDDDRGTVALGPAASQLTTYLEAAQEEPEPEDRPWHSYYLGVAGLGLVGVTLASLGVAGPLGLAGPAIGVAVALVLATLAVLHARESA
jgi:DNA-binding transcriptional ArsR family regulator